MKRIIDGKLYNTETAEQLAHRSYGTYGDFSFYEETLYVTKKGSYFLEYSGGPRSPYGVNEGTDGTRGDSGIIPFNGDEAFEWLVKSGKSELAAELFPEKITEA